MCTILEIKESIPSLDYLPTSILITDLDGNIEFVNNRFEELTGYKLDEIYGKKPSILKSGEHDEAFYKNMWDTILSGETFTGKVKNNRKDGTSYWQDVVIQPFIKKGKIENFIAYITDVTMARHHMLLQEAMFKNSYDSHIIWDHDRKCIEVHPSNNTEYPEFYESLLNRNMTDTMGAMESALCANEKIAAECSGVMIRKHTELFDAIDKDDTRAYNTIIQLGPGNGDTLVLEVIAQRFNSNKYYEVIRNISSFSRAKASIVNDLTQALKNYADTDYKIRSFLDAEHAKKYTNRNS